MDFQHLPVHSGVGEYEGQAQALYQGFTARDDRALEIFRTRHPRFLDTQIVWLPRNVSNEELVHSGLTIEDARLALARWYDFRDWAALAEFAAAAADKTSRVAAFEAAAEAVIDGDVAVLSRLLKNNSGLIRARSGRITHFDPPVHRATLLHYIGANGVEGYRQRTPANAVEVGRLLLESGAEVDAFGDMYGAPATTMSMLVSSCHPHQAGLQVPLAHLLVDFGAAVDGYPEMEKYSPLMTALVFGYGATAEALVCRGAKVSSLPVAAGLGRVPDTRTLLPGSSAWDRQAALALAAQLGHAEIVEILLDAGEDPNRYNPDGLHAHSTPLHQAALAGHLRVVQLLVERGAMLHLKDRIHNGTPLRWAEYTGKTDVAEYLRHALR